MHRSRLHASLRRRGGATRLAFVLLVFWFGLAAVAPSAHAAPTVSLAITSPRSSDSPLNIVIRCSDSERFTLRLMSGIVAGTEWTVFKLRDLETSIQICNNTVSEGRIPPPPRYDLALDESWFPNVDGVSQRISLWVQLVRNGVIIADAQYLLDRPVGQPQVVFSGSDIYGTGIYEYGFSGVTRSRTADIDWNVVEGAVSYTACLSGSGYASQCWNTTGNAINDVVLSGSEGLYTASVTALAPNGLRGSTGTASIQLDLSPPAAPADLQLRDLLSPTNRRLSWYLNWMRPPASDYFDLAAVEITRPDGQVVVFDPTIAGSVQPGIVCGSSTTFSTTVCHSVDRVGPDADDPDGVYSYRLRLFDMAGNAGPWSQPLELELDTMAPEPPERITAASATNQPHVRLDWPPVAAVASYALVRRRPDNTIESLAPTTDPAAYPGFGAGDGRYEFRVYSQDAAGNRSATYRAVQVEYDTQPPARPSASWLLGLTNRRTAAASWAGLPDTTRYHLRLTHPDGTLASRSVAAPMSAVDDLALSGGDGSYQLQIDGEDAAGNRSGLGPGAVIELDTTSPPAQQSAPRGSELTSKSAATISWQAPEAETDTTVLTVTGPGGATSSLTLPASTSSFTLSLDQGDGSYAVTTAPRDRAGNLAAPSPPLTLTLDTVGPAAPAAAPVVPSRTNVRPFRLNWPAVADAVAYELWVDDIHRTTVLTNSADLAGDDGEQVSIRIRGIDAAGNVGEFTSPAELLFDHSAPEVAVSLTATPDGSGAELRWETEPGVTAQVVRSYPDGQVEPVTATDGLAFFPARFGEAVQGKLTLVDEPGNVVSVPFGPIIPNQLALDGILVDRNGGRVEPGDLLSAVLLISNSGAADQPAAVVDLRLPAAVDLLSAQLQSAGDRDLHWSLGLLPSGASARISLLLRVRPDAVGQPIRLVPTMSSAIAAVQRAMLSPPEYDGVVQPLNGRLAAALELTDLNGGLLEVGDGIAMNLTLDADGQGFSGVGAHLPLPSWLTVVNTQQTTVASVVDPADWPIGELEAGQRIVLAIEAQVGEAGRGQTLIAAPSITSDQFGSRALTTLRLGPVRDPREEQPPARQVFLPLLWN